MKKIVLTGGGTAGHVTPNLALLPSLQERGYEIHYIGSYNGIEKKLIENAGIPYDGISSGKLRRYFDIKNFSDPFRVIKGYGYFCHIHLKSIQITIQCVCFTILVFILTFCLPLQKLKTNNVQHTHLLDFSIL